MSSIKPTYTQMRPSYDARFFRNELLHKGVLLVKKLDEDKLYEYVEEIQPHQDFKRIKASLNLLLDAIHYQNKKEIETWTREVLVDIDIVAKHYYSY